MVSTKTKKRFMKLKGLGCHIYSYLLLRHTRFQRGILVREIKQLKIERLHVGCGNYLVDGWLNIGLEKREEYGRILKRDGCLFLNYDLLTPWPIEDDTIRYMAASHFIEHFDLNQGIEFLEQCFRVMRRGGVIRLSCPDLEIYARNYVNNNKEFFDHKLIREWCCFKNAFTPGEILAAKAYDSGGAHKWFYDYPSLKHILEKAGFSKVIKQARLKGQMPDLERIEPDERELETVYAEAVKP